ncbi:unnamed protein product, partial [Gulo gulo]
MDTRRAGSSLPGSNGEKRQGPSAGPSPGKPGASLRTQA